MHNKKGKRKSEKGRTTKKTRIGSSSAEGISLSEYGLEGSRVRLRRLSEYGSVACLVERPTRET